VIVPPSGLPRKLPSASTPIHSAPCESSHAGASAPSSIPTVAPLPATTHNGAATLIDCQCVTGHPVVASRMWQ